MTDKKQVEEEVEGSPYRLLKPITFEGADVTEIAYDFDELSGKDLINAARQIGLVGTGDVTIMPIMSMEFQAIVFAMAAKKPRELIETLKGPDFLEVCARTMVFFTPRA